jgi:chromosome segregation ATPase
MVKYNHFTHFRRVNMSEVPLLDAKASLKKIVSLIVDISGLTSDYIPKLRTQPESILSTIEKLETEKIELLNKIDANNEEVNLLKTNISQSQRDIQKFDDHNQELQQKKQGLLDTIQQKQKQIEDTQASIRIKKEEFESRTTQLKQLNERNIELSREIEIFEKKLRDLEKELENTFYKKERYVTSYENRVAAMKILIDKKYINSTLYQFIRALQPGSALDLKNILLAIDMREDQAIRIIKKMIEENAPIELNQETGTILLKEEVDF